MSVLSRIPIEKMPSVVFLVVICQTSSEKLLPPVTFAGAGRSHFIGRMSQYQFGVGPKLTWWMVFPLDPGTEAVTVWGV